MKKLNKAFFQKFFTPNEKLRSWLKARTFAGTTKPKPLYICGFRRKNFFIVCGVVAALAVVIAGSGGAALSTTVKKADKFEAISRTSARATPTASGGTPGASVP